MRNGCSSVTSCRRASVICPNGAADYQAEEEAFLATALASRSVRRSKRSIFSFSERCRTCECGVQRGIRVADLWKACLFNQHGTTQIDCGLTQQSIFHED